MGRRTVHVAAAFAFVTSAMILNPVRTFAMGGATSENKSNHWELKTGKYYWYENGVKQGTYDDPGGVMGDGTVRGREIYAPVSDGWYWLDACYEGAKACDKEVWMPYIYQNEKDWDDAEIAKNAAESGDMAAQVTRAIKEGSGKWVRYDRFGKMYKGWFTVESGDQYYQDQGGNTYYYDPKTGLMAKGTVTIDGKSYTFDEVTGVLTGGTPPAKDDGTGEKEKLPVPEWKPVELAQAKAGDVVTYGSYEQDGDLLNGKEPVWWHVLDSEDGVLTLLSVDVLDNQPYDGLSRWLNEDFFHAAFSRQERAAIIDTDLVHRDNPFYDREDYLLDVQKFPLTDTTEKIWVLSFEDIEKYFGISMTIEGNLLYNGACDEEEYNIRCYQQDPRILGKSSAYVDKNLGIVAVEQGEVDSWKGRYDFSYAVGGAEYWLRTPARDKGYAATVNAFGGVNREGAQCWTHRGVRPVMRINIKEAEVSGSEEPRSSQAMTIAEVAKAGAGDTVTFGAYEQDNDLENGLEPIEWYVLDKADGEMTLLSVYLLEAKEYDDSGEDGLTWENCSLRRWLKNDFYDNAFNKTEMESVVPVKLVNEDNPFTGAKGGNDTTDRVWILSMQDLEKYFGIPMTKETNPIFNGTFEASFLSWADYAEFCYGKDPRICAKTTLYSRTLGENKLAVWTKSVAELNDKDHDFGYAENAGEWWLRTAAWSTERGNLVEGVRWCGDPTFMLDVSGDSRDWGNSLYSSYADVGVRPVIRVKY